MYESETHINKTTSLESYALALCSPPAGHRLKHSVPVTGWTWRPLKNTQPKSHLPKKLQRKSVSVQKHKFCKQKVEKRKH